MGNGKRNKKERSNIPYVQRMQAQKIAEITYHRNDAARIAMQVACVALNNTEGLGYLRLSRFAREVDKLLNEYYEDPVMGEAHLYRRLEQLGFIIKDGRMQAVENAKTGEIVPTKMLEGQG